jgi:SHOCT-like protein
MSEERKKVLEMLAAGKITAEEAEKLLDKLGNNTSNSAPAAEPPQSAPANPKYLRIVVDQAGRDQVNVRVPLSLVRSGRGLLAIMPKHVNERLAEYGINAGSFTTMDLNDLNLNLRELNIDVDKGNGKKVKIFCE